MKKVLFPSLFGLLFTTVMINHISAQAIAILQPNRIDPKAIRTGLNAPEPDPAFIALPLNAVSAKAIRTFNSSFKGTTDQQWYRAGENKFLTTFTSKDGRVSRALIDKAGYLYYGINYGKEQSLTKEQRRNIKYKYFDYTINLVCEIISDGQRVWVITLQDENNIVKTRLAEDGTIDELEHYHKNLPVKKTRRAKH